MRSRSIALADATARAIAAGRGLWIARALYFFQFGAVGAFFPYLYVYYRSIGLSGTQIGLIGSLPPLVGMIAGPLWGLLSDRFGAVRQLLILATAGSILAVLGLSAVQAFGALFLLTMVYAFFNNPIMPLLDSATLDLLEGQREHYGRQRLWGSIGFVITSWGFGLLLERIGLHWAFYGYVLLMFPLMILAWWLPVRRARLSAPLRRGLARLVRQRAWFFFSLSLVVLGIANSGMHGFLNIFVKEMGGSEGLIGTMWGVAALSEIPVMFLAAPLIVRLGPRRILAATYALYVLRWLLYGLMPSPIWAVPISLLHGLTFGALWVTGVAYVDALAPEELKATAQGLFFASFFGFSRVLGTSLSGLLFDMIGPAALFQTYALFGLVALGLFWWGSPRARPSRAA